MLSPALLTIFDSCTPRYIRDAPAAGGAPITHVSQQLGHADPSITSRVYAHYLPDGSRKVLDLLDVRRMQLPRNQSRQDGATDAEMKEWLGRSSEPHFRELEPDGGLVAESRCRQRRGLSSSNHLAGR
jgi:hypothetical protein